MALTKEAYQSHTANLSIGAMMPIAKLGEHTALKPSTANSGFALSIRNKVRMCLLEIRNEIIISAYFVFLRHHEKDF